MLSISRTTFPDGRAIIHPNNRMSRPLIQNISDIMKQAALDEAAKKWSKNKVKAGGLNHSCGQESALSLAKRLLNHA